MNCGPAAPLAHSPVLGTYPPCLIPTSLPPSRPSPPGPPTPTSLTPFFRTPRLPMYLTIKVSTYT
ncbi:hypothetical protein BOTBODRAFT_26303 [Botryobasidium botryosum FD-172 SS1]|uniref:Uncharacterized protein n=1 Tax=Botryobasidium botryosum (strain FD-172 SS1) TaxID=930990 RepID=A0A067N4L8_BOTB1|nr:hypothetical protein BOTBODRAFT_26303 [Botryobasidium botryosum FD-172 SS1]